MVEQHPEQLTPSETFFKHFQGEAIGIEIKTRRIMHHDTKCSPNHRHSYPR
jgi:hypothetical protein